jgi:putative nucleotidyltransferase with HDIG domain
VGLTDAVNPIPLLGDAQVVRRIRASFEDVSTPVAAYLLVVAITTAGTAVVLALVGVGFGPIPAVLSLAVVAALSEWRSRIALRGKVTAVRGKLTVSISLFPTVFAAVLFGPLAAMVVFGATATALNIPAVGRVIYACNRALIGASAAGAATAVSAAFSGGVGEIVAASTAAVLAAEVVDAAFTSLTYSLRGIGRWTDAARDLIPVIAASVPFYSPVVAILVLAYRDLSPWTLPLFFAPALAAQTWFILYQEQRRLASELESANEQLKAANLSFAKGLIATLDARDRYTAGHSAAVAVYARDIAERMGFDEEFCNLAYVSGLVHDIGKIGLPPGLLDKPGALTLEERLKMQEHSEIGEGILLEVDTYAEIASIVRHHHERVDGQGYPDGLHDEQIPLLSKIIAVADAYNAMTSDRPYRDAMPTRVARLRLAQAVGAQFETSVVAAFEAILAGANEDYRVGVGPRFERIARQATVTEFQPLAVSA